MQKLLLAAPLLLLAPPLAVAPSGYAVTDLGGVDDQGGPTAVNDTGQVVLNRLITPAPRTGNAALWQNGRLTDLGTLPPVSTEEGTYSEAYGLNNRGQIVGSAGDFLTSFMSGMPDCRGFLFEHGGLHRLTNEADTFQPFAINDQGQVAGRRAFRGFFYARGRLTPIGTFSHLPAGNASTARALNVAGSVVGWSTVGGKRDGPILPFHGFLWDPRTHKMRDLGTLPGHRNSYACGINNKGRIVGVAENESPGSFGFFGASAASTEAAGVLWSGDKMAALPPLPGDTNSAASSINSADVIVGQSLRVTAQNRLRRACLWDGGRATDLNALLPPGTGWTLEDARAINNKGWIVGNGTLNGKPHAFLLTPR